MAMKEGLIGRKRGMTQVFGEDGNRIPVTVVEAGPCTVVGVRTQPTHGYDALQLGFQSEPKKGRVTKPMAGLYKKAGIATPMKVLREVRLQKTENVQAYQVGQTLTVDLFTPGEFVDVGTGSRWNFRGEAVAGPLTGTRLRPVYVLKDYWFDWKTYHPATSVYLRGGSE